MLLSFIESPGILNSVEFVILFQLISFICFWRIFSKAGYSGWLGWWGIRARCGDPPSLPALR
jgi:hypothetical protein